MSWRTVSSKNGSAGSGIGTGVVGSGVGRRGWRRQATAQHDEDGGANRSKHDCLLLPLKHELEPDDPAPERAPFGTGLRSGSSTCSRMPLTWIFDEPVQRPVDAERQRPSPVRKDGLGARIAERRVGAGRRCRTTAARTAPRARRRRCRPADSGAAALSGRVLSSPVSTHVPDDIPGRGRARRAGPRRRCPAVSRSSPTQRVLGAQPTPGPTVQSTSASQRRRAPFHVDRLVEGVLRHHGAAAQPVRPERIVATAR